MRARQDDGTELVKAVRKVRTTGHGHEDDRPHVRQFVSCSLFQSEEKGLHLKRLEDLKRKTRGHNSQLSSPSESAG